MSLRSRKLPFLGSEDEFFYHRPLPRGAQSPGQAEPVYDQYSRHTYRFTISTDTSVVAGKLTENLTRSGPFSVRVRSPPWLRAMVRAMANPRPVPRGLVVKNGSKIRPR